MPIPALEAPEHELAARREDFATRRDRDQAETDQAIVLACMEYAEAHVTELHGKVGLLHPGVTASEIRNRIDSCVDRIAGHDPEWHHEAREVETELEVTDGLLEKRDQFIKDLSAIVGPCELHGETCMDHIVEMVDRWATERCRPRVSKLVAQQEAADRHLLAAAMADLAKSRICGTYLTCVRRLFGINGTAALKLCGRFGYDPKTGGRTSKAHPDAEPRPRYGQTDFVVRLNPLGCDHGPDEKCKACHDNPQAPAVRV